MNKQIERLLINLNNESPFFAVWTLNCNFLFTEEVKRFKLIVKEDKFELQLNEAWFNSLENNFRRKNVIKQCIYHIILHHWHFESKYKDDLKKFLICCALEIEKHMVKDNGVIMDEQDITVDSINAKYNLQLQRDKDFQYYYNTVIIPPEDKDKSSQGYNEDEGFGTDELGKFSLENSVKSLIMQSSGKAAGSHIKDYMSNYLEKFKILPRKIMWQQILRQVLNRHGKKIIPITSKRKYNKWFPDTPGQVHQRKGSVFVVVDTSCSITEKEYAEILSELIHLSRKYDITMAHADTQIRYIGKFNVRNKDMYKIHGRGGTDFTDAIKYYNESDHTCCIYFTDSYGSSRIPPNKKLVWCINNNTKGTNLMYNNNCSVINLI